MRLNLLFTSLFLGSILYAQVGIGTDNPQYPLDVVGVIRAQHKVLIQSQYPSVQFYDNNSNTDEKSWQIITSANKLLIRALADVGGTPGGKYFSFIRTGNNIKSFSAFSDSNIPWFDVNNSLKSLKITDGTTEGLNNPIFTIVNDHVGIGQNNPAYPLDVDGSIRSKGKIIVQSNFPYLQLYDNNSEPDQKNWQLIANNNQFLIRSLADSGGTPGSKYFSFIRSGNNIKSFSAFSDSNVPWFNIDNESKSFSISDGTNSGLDPIFTIKDGHVGVKEAQPQADLHLKGALIVGDSTEYPAGVDSQCVNPGEIAFSNGVFYGCSPNDGVGTATSEYEWIPLNNE